MAKPETTARGLSELQKQVIMECLAEQIVKLRGILQQVREDMWFNVGPSKGTLALIDEVLGKEEEQNVQA